MSRDFTVLKAVRPTPHREHELGDELFRPTAAIAARLGQATRHPCRIKLPVLQHPFITAIAPQAVISLSEKRRSNPIISPSLNSDNKFYAETTLKGLYINDFL